MSAAPRMIDLESAAARISNPFRRRAARMLLLFAALVALTATINVTANPFGVWRISIVDPIFRRVALEDSRIAAPYVLRTSSPHTVMFGTSRMHSGIPVDQV